MANNCALHKGLQWSIVILQQRPNIAWGLKNGWIWISEQDFDVK